MRTIRKIAAAIAASVFACAAPAAVFDYAYTYSGLAWAFSSSQSGFNGCSTLYLDVTGDFYNSSDYAAYGQLSCPSLQGSYSSSGSVYLDSFGDLNMTVELGVAHKLVCVNINGATFSGTCQIYNNSGTQTGTAVISLL